MRKPNETIAGRRFERWMVKDCYIVTERGERKWLCRCDCGTERYVLERALKAGTSRSCGCLQRENTAKAIAHDIAGKTFGELTVIGRDDGEKRGKGVRWRCRCSCGSECVMLGTLLVTGRRTHCGGKAHEKNYAHKDIAGQKFGYLTALYPLKDRNPRYSMMWHCRCDCGNEVDVSYNALLYSNMKSCGCQKRRHNQELPDLLTHVAGTSVDMIKSKRVPVDNTTGYRGVYLVRGKWLAKIVFQRKAYYLGTYDNIEDAAEARREAEELLFEGAAEHYERWNACAGRNREWAEAHPIEIFVYRGEDGRLCVQFLPGAEEMKQICSEMQPVVAAGGQ